MFGLVLLCTVYMSGSEMKLKSKLKAFTLIELLVSVAIIAILAAIALPNFLEAQTRAKVSRAKTDLRTISVGVEMYRIDNNRYPPDAQFNVMPYLDRLRRLTTPISYMTSVPADPFANISKIEEYAATKPVNPYIDPTTGKYHYPLTYDFATRMLPTGGIEDANAWAYISSSPNTVLWGLRSCGPDKSAVWLGDAEAPYDPTNGTVSKGNIYWTGPGKGEDQPLIY